MDLKKYNYKGEPLPNQALILLSKFVIGKMKSQEKRNAALTSE